MAKQIRNANDTSRDLTEIAVIIDRSGSMSSIQDDMQGGLWTTILQQHRAPGLCRISAYQFDDEWEIVFEGRPSGDITVEDCKLVPRGATALNDAVVKSLAAIEHRVSSEPESERPDRVVSLVITDGAENASTETTTADAHKAIQRATETFGWQFVYLAADSGAFEDGERMTAGRPRTRVARFEKDKAREAYACASEALLEYRTGRTETIDVDDLDGA
jgi:Mg-chelatase subunit ChlD